MRRVKSGEAVHRGWHRICTAYAAIMRVRVRYCGRVQGVGFRATARFIARGYSITGWVRNEHDGTVLLEAQGASADVEGFLAALAERMSGCITHTDRSAVMEIEREAGFEIQR